MGLNYVETTAVARAERGGFSAGLGYSFVPKQGGTRDDAGRHRNHYLFAEAAYEVPGVPVTLTTSAGYERGYFDEVAGGGKWDWSFGAEAKLARARLGLHYTGSDAPGHHGTVVASLFLDL